MSTVSELLRANLHGVFGNRDASSRRATAERIFKSDVAITGRDAKEYGRETLLDKVEAMLAEFPDSFVFVEDGLCYASETTGALAWAFGPEGSPMARGIDIISVRNGGIVSLETFFSEPDESA